MARRVIVRLYLPLEMGAVGRICKAVAEAYPNTTVRATPGGKQMAIITDPDAVPNGRGPRLRLTAARARKATDAG